MGKKTLVVGLGNPILTDDGVGVKVAYEVAAALPSELSTSTTITEASVGGLRLMEMMVDYQKAIIIDAYMPLNGQITPGKIHRMTLEDLKSMSPTQHSASAHDTTLVTALETGRQLGLGLPDEIVIFAIEVENVMDFSEDSTEAVKEAIPVVLAAVLNELEIK
jgi:hydrogenase maturation protease